MSKRLVVASCLAMLLSACAVTRYEVPAVRGSEAPAECATGCHRPVLAAVRAGSPGEGEAGERRGRDELMFYMRSYPATGLPDAAVETARAHFAAQRALMAPSAVAALPTWSPVGPSPIIGENHGQEWMRRNCSGRATAVLVDPRNSNVVYAGAAQGGVWKTTDGGTSWTPLTATAPSQATGFMAFDPTDPDILYVGTGEPHGSDSHYGAGLLKTTNGGGSWTVLGADVFSGRAISAVVVDPQNPQQLWVGVSTRVGGLVDVKPGLAEPGIYRSTDGGATWPQAVKICDGANPRVCANVSAISMEKNNPSVIYAGFDGLGVFKTTNGGSTWDAILGPAAAAQGKWFPWLGDAGRVEVLVSPSDPQRVWAGIQTIRPEGVQGVSGVLFRSSTGGQFWDPLTLIPQGYFQEVSYCGQQCSYDNVLAVHPTDANVLAAGGAAMYSNGWDGTIFITRDAGTTFTTHDGLALDRTSHPDLHSIAFDPQNPTTIWIANDGGIYRSTDGGASWADRNGNLSTLQFQSITQHPTDPNVLFGGMQDNAKAKTTDGGATWVGLDAGDGGFSAIDPFDTRTWYGTRYSLKGGPMQFQRNDNNGSAAVAEWPGKIGDSSGVDLNDNVLFYAPLVVDPNVVGRVYWATSRLYRSDNRGDSFTAISTDLTRASSRFSAISAVSVRRGDSNTIVVGTGDGKVQVTRNGGGSWTDLTGATLPNRFVSDVFAYDSSIYYAAFSGFGANTPGATGHVFRTTNGGTNWTDISRTGLAGGLPDLPVTALAVDRDETGVLYVGTDLGVYRTLNDGASWEPFNEGMPLLAIYDLDLTRHPDGTRRLAAATHGRSIYRIVLGDGGGTDDVTAPTTPTGQAAGTVGTSYNYTTGGSICASGGGVEYQFDWGDGTTSGWLTPTLAPGGPDEGAAVAAGALSGASSAAGATGLEGAGPVSPTSGAPIESVTVGSEPPFSYYYQGRLVVLEPSPYLVAVDEGPGAAAALRGTVVERESWSHDPRSERDALASRGLALFRAPSMGAGKGAAAPQAAGPTALERALADGLPAQPVFELGGATKIASDEVIVGFRSPTPPDAAQRFVERHAASLGLVDTRALFGDLFMVRIASAAGGRAYAVSRALARLPEVLFAEPNHVLVFEPDGPQSLRPAEGRLPVLTAPLRPLVPEAAADPSPRVPPAHPMTAPTWSTVLFDNFDTAVTGWEVYNADMTTEAGPVYTNARVRTSAQSIYMTGNGAQGIPPPGPYPGNVDVFAYSPIVNLAAFEEAYVEFWFWARFENPYLDPGSGQVTLYDYGKVWFFDANTQASQVAQLLAVPFTGKLADDRTAINGWRRMLLRVPPAFHTTAFRIVFEFISDAGVSDEGLYIDELRIVGTPNVDTESIGNDPYGGRQYELKNVGQIAGLGNDDNDLNVVEAWNEVTVSPGVVVAVIDDGVEPGHPDLNLVTGYDGDTGAVGGAPRDANSNHGTACAGNVGAIRDNGIGVAGTAPGVKIMPVNHAGSEAGMANGISIAVSHGASVLSNSWGWVDAPSNAITTAFQNALAAGRSVVIAAGNGPDRPPWSYETAFPCNLTAQMAVICVGASSPTDEHKSASSSDGLTTWGSSYIGAGPDVVAPGPWSYTTDRLGSAGYNQDQAATGVDPNYEYQFGGTSSSTPKAAGIVALMLSKNPSLTPAEVKSILRQTADDIGAPGEDDKTGTGRIDARAAVLASGGGGGNPVPVLTGIAPSSAPAGSLGFTLTANGSGFINGSVVRWNGADQPTSFVSAVQLTAIIAAADVATAGTAQVTVFTPAPGGGTSAAQTFTITGGGGGNTVTASHAWTNNGSYPVKARARCASDTAKVSGDSGSLTVTITGGGGGTITTPRAPAGPAAGVPATAYEYRSGGATCSLGEASQYQFDWGDGTMSTWITPAGLAGADGLLASAAAPGSAMPVETAGNPRADLERLVPIVRQKGRVRVIVTLREPFAPEGLMAPASALAQQDRIAQAQEALLARLAGETFAVHRRYRFVAALALEADARALERLAGSPEVARIEEDRLHEMTLEQSVPLIGAPAAWAAGATGAGQAVAILDTGVERNHPFLAGKVVAEACFSTTAQGTTSACPNGQATQIGVGAATPCSDPTCDHGTHCAGIAAGKGTTFSGVAREASIIAVQVFSLLNGGGTGSYPSDDIAGLEWVYGQRNAFAIASVNLSLGSERFYTYCDGESPAMKQAIDNLRAAGIATAIATGNNYYTDSISHPACISSAVAVGSTTKFDGVSSFSNSASMLELLAPGSDINSSVTGGGFGVKDGTSMATPHVAGAWAVLKSKKPTATVDEVLAAFTSTGVSITDGRNGLTRPRIRVDQAAAALSGGGAGDVVTQHAWAAAGGYPVRVRARCAVTQTVVSDWSGTLNVTISAAVETVSAPTSLAGPLTGAPGQSLAYTTGGAASSQGNPVQYFFDWIDGTNSGWLPVGTTGASHAWGARGSYGVRTKARSATNTAVESGWSATLPVEIRLTSGPDLVGSWRGARQVCKTKKGVTRCTITGKFTVVNNGTVNSSSTQAWALVSVDSAPSGDDIRISSFSVSALKPRAKKAFKLNFKVPTGYTAAGLYLLGVVDPADSVAETNESNNVANGGILR